MGGIDEPKAPRIGPIRPPQAPAPVPPRQAPPLPRRRLVRPDLTGFYEHRCPVRGKASAIMLQLSQAGRALVGWFCGAPPFIDNALGPTVSREAQWNDTWMPPGVLLAILPDAEVAPADPLKFFWRTATHDARRDPADPSGFLLLDPPNMFDGSRHRHGWLRILPPFLEQGQEVAFCFQAPTAPADPSRYDRFIRVGTAARLPNDLLRELGAELQAKLIPEQVQPVPDSLTELVMARIAPPMSERPPIAPLFEAWLAAPNPSARRIARDSIVDHLRGTLNPRLGHLASDPHREALYAKVRAHLAWKTLTIGNQTRTLLDWYRLLAGEAMDALRKAQAADPRGAPRTALDDATLGVLLRAGIDAPGAFLYTFGFTNLSPNLAELALGQLAKTALPKLRVVPGIEGGKPGGLLERDVVNGMRPSAKRQGAAGLLDMSQVVKLKGQLFRLDVKKERVKVDAQGLPVLKDGKPEVDPSYAFGFDTGIGTLSAPKTANVFDNGFVGVMGEVGAGLSVESKQGKLAISGSLKQTSILSSLELGREDFAYATLRGVLLGGPTAKLSDYLSLETFTTRFFEVILPARRGGFSLSTSETETLTASKIKLEDLKPKFSLNVKEMVNEYNKKMSSWTQPQVEARILELSTSIAWVLPLFDATKPILAQPPPLAPPAPPAERKFEPQGMSIDAFFQVGSANLDEIVGGQTTLTAALAGAGGTARDALEVGLATYRALFASPTSTMVVLGLASPEQPERANQDLSERRAKAVEGAVRDALGQAFRIPGDGVRAGGRGESLARAHGLRDPEATGLSPQQFAAQFPAEAARWPAFRRVDLFVDDWIVVSVRAKDKP